MKAISVKASGASKSVQRVLNFVAASRLNIAVAGAAAAYLGCLFSVDSVTFIGAAVAMAAVRPVAKKGGKA